MYSFFYYDFYYDDLFKSGNGYENLKEIIDFDNIKVLVDVSFK